MENLTFIPTNLSRYPLLFALTTLLALSACSTLAPEIAEQTPALAAQATNIAHLSVSNTQGVPSQNELLLHAIGNACPKTPCDKWQNLQTSQTGTLSLKNTGNAAMTLALSSSNPDFVLPGGETSLALAAGQSYALRVRYAPKSTLNKGVYRATLKITANGANATFPLRGAYNPFPEGVNELFLGPLVNKAFGYQTNLGSNARGGLTSAAPDSALAGEEVRAAYWQAADSSKPVSALQLAAFHGCCKQKVTFALIPQGSNAPAAQMTHGAAYGQTILPKADGSRLTTLSKVQRRSFEVRIAQYSSDPSKGIGNGNLGVRFWPLRDKSGKLIAHSYLVAQDNVAKGCGTTATANCDFNDGIYLLKNVKPAP